MTAPELLLERALLSGEQITLQTFGFEKQNIGEKKNMNATKQPTETAQPKTEVEYIKAGWINKSKSGQALTFKLGERFYSVPISSIKDLLTSDKSGVTFSEVKTKA